MVYKALPTVLPFFLFDLISYSHLTLSSETTGMLSLYLKTYKAHSTSRPLH